MLFLVITEIPPRSCCKFPSKSSKLNLVLPSSSHAQQSYTEDADLTDETDLLCWARPAGGPSKKSVKICIISPICVPTPHARQGGTEDADLTDDADLLSWARPAGGPLCNQCKSA
jgi:hypothetical protein